MEKKSSEARIRANSKYDAKTYQKFLLRIRNEEYDIFEAFIKEHNFTKNGFINKAIKYVMENYDIIKNQLEETENNE